MSRFDQRADEDRTQTFAFIAPMIARMTLTPPIEYALWGAAVVASLWFAWRAGVFNVATPAGKRRGADGALSRDVSGIPAAVWFVCAAVTFLSLSIGAGISASIPREHRGPSGSLQELSISTFVSFALAACVGLVLLYLVQARTSERSGTRFEPRDLSIGAWCFALTVPLYAVTVFGAKWFWSAVLKNAPPETAHAGLEMFLRSPASPWGLLFAATACVITPIAEELIYRVFAQSAARSLLGDAPPRVWASVLIVAGVFAFSHAAGGGPVPWAAVPGLFVLAVAMGIAYEHTRRPGVPMTMHALFNFGNLALAWLQSRSS